MAEIHPRVREHLESSGVAHHVHDHAALPVPITSPADFAAALGYPLGRIMKTLICRARSSGDLVAVVCPMDARVDFRATAAELGCGRIESADAAELESATGYQQRGVSPLGLDDRIRIAIARQALDHPTVLVGGGEPGVEIEIAPGDLIRITGGHPIDFSRSD